MPAPDVLIVGGGVVGLSLARELSRRDRSVTVLERDAVGARTGAASWAGAGMLPPASREHAVAPLDRLRAYSHGLWDDWAAGLTEDAGVDPGYERRGTIEAFLQPSGEGGEDDPSPYLAARLSPGVRWEPLTPDHPHRPPLGEAVAAAIRVPDAGQVRNPRLLKALRAACLSEGVELREGIAVRSLRREGNRTPGVRTESGDQAAGAVVVCGGAWTARLTAEVGFAPPIHPVRGQIALLRCDTRPFLPTIECGPWYLVPRADGRVLVGATQEPEAGFDARTTVCGVAGLLDFARQLVPSLRDAAVERTWAGLRPGSPDGVPLLGRVPSPCGGRFENLFVAAGHFRDGLQQSPGTAAILADLLDGLPPAIDLDGFVPDRFLSSGDR